MNDRGMVKWAPFNSVINGSEILKEIKFEKNKGKQGKITYCRCKEGKK